MNYVCIIDGVVEFSSTSAKDFAHYIMMYEDEIFGAEERGEFVQMLSLTDDEFDTMFPSEEEDE
ncbi:hypothetical protein SCREM1_110 [Synechococcus phage S-CREM1]|nr:hypothetical protein SCREM1_110 [Synechococcus phage S-CREM1]